MHPACQKSTNSKHPDCQSHQTTIASPKPTPHMYPNELPPSDAQDTHIRKRIAEELDRNFLVEAAAGTGKTTSMVNRMVALIATGQCRIQQLAAVTFTRKAAAELRDRFQAELRQRAVQQQENKAAVPAETRRLAEAADYANQAFVGTIHSFCAALLRERPIEFGVDPGFRELDETEELKLREQAWHENIADLMASEDPLLAKLQELNLERSALKDCYDRFIEYRDIEDWPCSIPDKIDLDELKGEVQAYIDDMRQLLPYFPSDRGKDKLMDRYETIVRASARGGQSLGNFFALLERFDTGAGERQMDWPKKETVGIDKLGRRERDRWEEFRETHVSRAMTYWCRLRYSFVVDFVRRAVKTYERRKLAGGGIDFQDLLLTVARGLRVRPELRRYFQNRYSHLLVDEFQDTDPIQAEMMLYLTAANADETDWAQCVPKPGSLFLVGDPKQSIYRFRRGDIVTFNRVKEIIQSAGGERLALSKNFRSRDVLIQWNNRIYREKFEQTATDYSPVAEDMLCGREDKHSPQTDAVVLSGVYRLELPTDATIDSVHQQEAESIAKLIRHAIDSGKQIHRTHSDKHLRTNVRAGDFLIVPWGKKCINRIVAAMEAYDLPYEVSGGNPLSHNAQLTVLIDCLRAIDDPSNPVPYLAVLRGFFGLSDRDLHLFKHAGGSFNYAAHIPTELDDSLASRFQRITAQFQAYQRWLRSLPYAAAVTRIAEDLGLFAAAAASAEGNMQTGGLFKAIEWLRQQSWDFDSATDLIQFLEEIVATQDTDGCPALPSDENVVRIMNLHKAKGLEAPIVFLADTTGKYRGEVRSHMNRRGTHPVGYMGITTKYKVKDNFYKTKEIATPDNWTTLQAEEQRFLDAEANRLLYVATTRAGCALIVSTAKDNSNWGSLYPYLQDAPAIAVPDISAAAGQQTSFAKGDSASSPTPATPITTKWSTALEPSYAVTTAKKLGLKGVSRPTWETSGDYGHQWGSAVHELLEICTKSPGVDLRPTALRLTEDYNLATDRIEELCATVQSVTQSDIWSRAQSSHRCYSELPFETLLTNDAGFPTIIRGVIDLIFEETATDSSPSGWVIVDYKTDDIQTTDIPAAINYYRNQLTQYAQSWCNITGNVVKELGLYFTRIDRYIGSTLSSE
jgi:ATP-dependent helicase/nuclease subunit A